MSTVADGDRAPLDPRGRCPMYIVVAERLEKRIKAGEFGESGRLPSRGELAEWYGVGAGSIKKAMGVLKDRGLVEVVPGMGTFTL